MHRIRQLGCEVRLLTQVLPQLIAKDATLAEKSALDLICRDQGITPSPDRHSAVE